MTPERLSQVEEIVEAALLLQGEERTLYLDHACGAQGDLRREVESLLAQESQAEDFLRQPVADAARRELAERSNLAVGCRVGPYRIVCFIGAGGMGEVYKAYDTRLERDVALKFLPTEYASDTASLDRFQREARAASALNHPHICTVYDIGDFNSRPFIAIEYLEGSALNQRLHGQPLERGLIEQVGIQIAGALKAAHGKGIVHRDLKPGNIFVTQLGEVKLLDFGLAKHISARDPWDAKNAATSVSTEFITTPGMILGTMQYMSPEQAMGQDVDHRSDIFSLGVVLYHMATGHLPFRGQTPGEIVVAIAHDRPAEIASINPKIPAGLDRIVLKCLEKDREKRYQSAGELLEDLGRIKAGEAPRRPPLGRLAIAAVVLTALAVAGLYRAGWFRLPIPATPIQALAVLPLENLSGDPNQEYFADGMTEALTLDLAQIAALTVKSRTSVMQFKGTKKALPEIARQLKVDAMVVGSVARAGDRVRITAELILASTDRHLWGKSYERSIGDILTLQNEVAQAIADEIRTKVTPQERSRLKRIRNVNPAAYEAYLKGRYYWNQFTEEGFQKSMDQFKQAIQIDPNYAEAYAGLADAWGGLQWIGGVPADEAFPQELAAAQKALDLDDTLPEVHLATAWVKSSEWDWPTVGKEDKRAIELNPGNAQAHLFYSTFLRLSGRKEASINEAKRSLELDPLAALANEALADAYASARQYDLAIEQYKKTLDLYPNHAAAHNLLGWAYFNQGMYDQAVEEIGKSVALDKGDPELSEDLGYMYARQGKKAEARKILRELKQISSLAPVSDRLALIYTALGEKEQALAALEQAYRDHSQVMTWLKVDPRFDSLRSDPRFKDLLRRVGMPD